MGIDRTDFLNGMRGVLEAFQVDAHDKAYWEFCLDRNNVNLRRWYNHEPHLYSWHFGRHQAYLSILSTFPMDEGREDNEVY